MSNLSRSTHQLLSPLLAIGIAMALGAGLLSTSLNTSPAPRAELRGYQLVAEDDDEVILPARVAAAIARTENSLKRAEGAIDDDRRLLAMRSLRAVAENIRRAYRVGMRQMSAAPADEEAETTPGPDSVAAVLDLDQRAITRLAGLYDNLRRPRVVARLGAALNVAYNNRSRMLTAVVRLDPEGAGADYSDGMADTVDAYADEVATVTDARTHDRLTKAARAALTRAVARSRAAEATVTAAFGGGE